MTLLPKKQCAVTVLNAKQVCVCFGVCPSGQASLTLPVALALNLPPCLGLGMWRDPDSECGCRTRALAIRVSCSRSTDALRPDKWEPAPSVSHPYPVGHSICTLIELRQWQQSIPRLMLFCRIIPIRCVLVIYQVHPFSTQAFPHCALNCSDGWCYYMRCLCLPHNPL